MALEIRTATGLVPADRLEPETLCFQRNGAATAERVEDRRRVAIGRLENLLTGSSQYPGIVGALPLDQLLKNPEEPLPLELLIGLGGELLRPRRRVVDQ